MNTDTTLPPQLSRLTDLLWTGGALPYREDAAIRIINTWRQVGIGAVVDCRAEWSDDLLLEAVAPDITYINPGVVDGGQRMDDTWFDTITAFANTHIANGTGVLVHCHSGINRGPSGAFAVLLTLGWDPEDAMALIQASRPAARVAYADDALDWWRRRCPAASADQYAKHARLEHWHQHDGKRI
jgi:dual specificity phosphatase 3